MYRRLHGWSAWSAWSGGTACTGVNNCSSGTCVSSCTPVNGGWSTLPAASTVTCGDIEEAKCNNPTPSCGGAECPGSTAPSAIIGTKCNLGTHVLPQCQEIVHDVSPTVNGKTYLVVIISVENRDRFVDLQIVWVSAHQEVVYAVVEDL